MATTDPLQIIVSGLDTVATKDLMDYLERYCSEESVDKVVFGESRHKDGNFTAIHSHALGFSRKLKQRFPELEIDWQDEFGSSRRAREILLNSGVSKKKRREKERVDKIAAVLILQDYLGHY